MFITDIIQWIPIFYNIPENFEENNCYTKQSDIGPRIKLKVTSGKEMLSFFLQLNAL